MAPENLAGPSPFGLRASKILVPARALIMGSGNLAGPGPFGLRASKRLVPARALIMSLGNLVGPGLQVPSGSGPLKDRFQQGP